jgi:hypothetical protein
MKSPKIVTLVFLCLLYLGCESQSPTVTTPESKIQSEEPMLQAVQRPIEDWVAAQGTFCWPDGMGGCFLFVPPVENFQGWSDPAKGICAAFDYAGLADEWITSASGGTVSFGTTVSGSVTERPLADGRAEIHVRLHTRNAMTFAVDGCNDFSSDPLLFGHRADEILAGSEAALGNVYFDLKYISPTPGAPFPDLLRLLYFPEDGEELLMTSIYVSASGPLGAAYGVADGTPGSLTCVQTGLYMTNFMGATGDAFPAESINLRVVGRGGRGNVN